MFYTRPKIEPLNLDLVRLDGGGSCPSQFYGTTVDGQSLYIRYRGGWLSAHRGCHGCRPGSEDEELISLGIGPNFHGDILLEQVCDLLGLTVRGIKPPFTEEDRVKATEQRPVLDWSGRTTYWQELLQVTKKGTELFVKTLKAVFQDIQVLTWENADFKYKIRDSLEGYQGGQVILGVYPDEARLSSLLDGEGFSIQDCESLFLYIIRFQFDSNRRPDKEFFVNYDQFNKKFYDSFGEHAIVAERSFGTISGEFATAEPASDVFTKKLNQVIEECFGRSSAWVDPQGTVLRVTDRVGLHSRDLADWCAESPNHYISWLEPDLDNGKVIVGVRAL